MIELLIFFFFSFFLFSFLGLPAKHFSYVKNIDPGLPLFLFNYSNKELHGIFEAASSGEMSINPYAWTKDGSGRTLYPAQVLCHGFYMGFIFFC